MIAALLIASSLIVADPPATATAAPAPAPRSADTDRFASDVADLSDIVDSIVKNRGVPGLAVAVVTSDRLVGLGVAGVRQRDTDEKIERNDRFHLGSCTKAITATLAAQLVAEGSLKWDATVGDSLGATVKGIDESWKAVTLEELLKHRGGAPASVEPAVWSAAWECKGSAEECRAAFVATILTKPIAQPRGTYVYSNQGYSIAARMLEVATKKDWETLVVDRLLKPLGVTSAGFGPPSQATNGKAPRGHGHDGKLNDGDNPAAIAPGGRLHLTMEDWARVIALHLRGETTGELGITAAGFKRLHTPYESDDTNRYACGWNVTSRPWGGRVLTHNGSNNRWFCVAWLAPDKGFAVIAACNQGGDAASKACDDASSRAISWWTEREKKTPPADATK